MNTLKKINFAEIKKFLKKYSIDVSSNLNDNDTFLNIKTLFHANEDDLSFFSNIKYLGALKLMNAKACIIEKKYINYLPKYCEPIIVNDPYLTLAILTRLFYNETLKSNGKISEHCIISKNVKIHSNVQIEPFSIISNNSIIHDNVYIGSNSFIGPNVEIHKETKIHDNVTITNSIIMDNCEIQSGARIGGDGFGFEEKSKQKIFHSGNVIIKNNTLIGSNTTIDRAAFDSTIIGQFSNLDNLVQIAHNVVVGDYAIIAAQVGIAGSTTIGKSVKIGGQAGISGHLTIGDNVTIAAKSGVTKNIINNKIVAGFPAKDIKLWKKEIIRNNLKK